MDPSMRCEPIPQLCETVVPPRILGTAALTHAAFAGADASALYAMIGATDTEPAARDYDTAIALQLAFRRSEALDLQDEALDATSIYRVGDPADSALRVLALLTPGDLMVNTPLDFLSNHLDVRLDLLHILPNRRLPDEIPDHDVAFVATTTEDPDTLARVAALFDAWPRPILNDPRFVPRLARDTLAAALRDIDGILSPTTVDVCRATLEAHLGSGGPLSTLVGGDGSAILVRPHGSHAGAGLRKITGTADLRLALQSSSASRFYVSAFVDYRSGDGLFRKYRVAFIDRAPFLCHMAVSSHWMIHYLNAGMTENAAKRADEARAMAHFNAGFATRHADAFAALHDVLGFDFYSIDCAETRDGRLLLFEADTAAIIHMMDPPDLFPYKPPQMRRVVDAFGRMLKARSVR